MNEDRYKSAARSSFSTFLKSQKLRRTPEREQILDAVLDINGQFNVQQLHEAVARECRVSTATIYNTLTLLIEAGIIKRHHFDGRSPSYEKCGNSPRGTAVLRLICTECGKMKDEKDIEIAKLLLSRRFPAFHTTYFTLCAYGVCSRCARKNRKKQNIIT